MSPRTQLVAVVVIMTVLLVASCGGSEAKPPPGSSAVYARIAKEKDCVALQHEFDVAMSAFGRGGAGSEAGGRALAYAEAANDRMEELDCRLPFADGEGS